MSTFTAVRDDFRAGLNKAFRTAKSGDMLKSGMELQMAVASTKRRRLSRFTQEQIDSINADYLKAVRAIRAL